MTVPGPGPVDLEIRPDRGPRLAGRLWPVEAPRATLLIAHGHGEHGGSYADFARAVGPAAGVDVLAADFRGHGRSDGRRGVIRRYDDLLDDLDAWLDRLGREHPGRPVFLLGHSNGGLAAIRLLETRPAVRLRVAGLILSNPSLRLIANAPLWKRAAGQILLRVAPWVTFDTGIDEHQLTGAADAGAAIADDPLRHQRISAPTYFGMVAHGPLAIADAGRLGVPTLLILGGADPIADPAAGRAFFDRLGAADRTLRVFDAMRHEPIHEVDHAEVFAAIVDWLDARSGASSRG